MNRRAAWNGSVSIRPGIVAFVGHIGTAPLHAHAAVQVYSCERGMVEVTDAEGRAAWAPAAVIPAGAKHSVVAAEGTIGTTVFVDPSSRWAPLAGTWAGSPETWTDEERGEVARRVVSDAFASTGQAADSFGGQVDQWVRSRLPDAVRVPELAASLAVSEATLRRRATIELGIGVRAYVRWVRLIVALENVAAGASITDAAAAAGFADGSHATRACREMFGLSPSDAIAQLSISSI